MLLTQRLWVHNDNDGPSGVADKVVNFGLDALLGRGGSWRKRDGDADKLAQHVIWHRDSRDFGDAVVLCDLILDLERCDLRRLVT